MFPLSFFKYFKVLLQVIDQANSISRHFLTDPHSLKLYTLILTFSRFRVRNIYRRIATSWYNRGKKIKTIYYFCLLIWVRQIYIAFYKVVISLMKTRNYMASNLSQYNWSFDSSIFQKIDFKIKMKYFDQILHITCYWVFIFVLKWA